MAVQKGEPMDDLISRQAAIDAIFVKPAWHGSDGSYYHSDDIRDAIEQLPSAQPEIIRCKDCEYFHKSFCEIWSKFGTIQTREKGYCYMAERRTDE